MGCPTDTATRWMRGKQLALGQDVLAAADADRHDRHAAASRARYAAPANSSPISGPDLRVPSGKIATGVARREHVLQRAQRGPVGGAPLDLHRAERVEQPAPPSGVENRSSLARKRTVRRVMKAANGMSRIDRCDGATMYAPVLGTRSLPDDPHPEHHLEQR